MAEIISGNYDALAWVQEELQASLDNALQSLHRYIDDNDDSSSLESCISQLHQTNGTVDMLNLNGAKLLSSEIMASANQLPHADPAMKTAIQDSLIKSLLILPNYLKVISTEFSDDPLRLLTTINDLREAHGEQPLNESDLFTPNLAVQLPDSVAPKPIADSMKHSAVGAKLSHIYQISLLRWFKDNDTESLQRMEKIFNFLRRNSLQEKSIILWWAAAGIIEALQDSGLIVDKQIKSKVGKLNKSIELFSQHGEQELLALFPNQLLSELLLQVAHSSSSGKHVTLLKNTFDLNFFNPSQHQKIYNLSGDALDNVHLELLESLQAIKEQVDQFDRHSEQSLSVFEQLPEQLINIADTLQLLGENSSGTLLLQQQSESLSTLLTNEQIPDEEQLASLADVLLQIERQLKNIHVDNEQSGDSLELQKHVLGECLYELNLIKDTLAILSEQPEKIEQHLEDISRQLKLVSGSVSMVNLNEIASLLQNTDQQIVDLKKNTASISQQELTWLAEIIASCELYMEGIQQGASQQSQLLINAQSILINFEQSESDDKLILDLETPTSDKLESDTHNPSLAISSEDTSSSINTETELVETSVARYIRQNNQLNLTVEVEPSNSVETPTSVERYIQQHLNTDAALAQIQPEAMTGVERYIQAMDTSNNTELDQPKKTSVQRYIDQLDQVSIKEELSSISAVLKTEDTTSLDDIDPEIAEIFIEEANEVLADFKVLIPQWLANHDLGTLGTIRRHFHTLKGSGRMAGTKVIADLAWAVENLLNEILEDKQPLIAALDKIILDAQEHIPELLTRFTNRNLATTEQVEQIIGLTDSYPSESESESELSITDEDDELQQIFNDEAIQHIETFKQALHQQQAPFSLNKELLRAAHSLKGCANIAQVMPVAVVATQLDKSLRTLYEHNIALDEQPLATLNDVITGLDQFIAKLPSSENEQDDILPLAEQLIRLMPSDTHLKSADDNEKLVDPEFLVVYLEETDELLNLYNSQLAIQQQEPENLEHQAALHHTLQTLTDNSKHAQLPVLVTLYQLLDKLTQHSESNHKDVVSLVEQCYEHINDQIELLIQNKPASDISEFEQLVLDRLNPAVIESAPENEWFTPPNDEPELLEAFTEEFVELLESSEDAIKRWSQNHDDHDASQQLQRVLHTIKGGARLTDLAPIAEISHQIETMVSSVVEHQHEVSDDFFSLLQQAQDRLAEIQERLVNNEPLPVSRDILIAIANFTGQAVSVTSSNQPQVEQLVETAEKQTKTNVAAGGGEQIRVRADLLDFLTNFTGEVNISRDRVGQQNSAILLQLAEMESTVSRLQDQLRNLEIETETQILFRYEDKIHDKTADFDPLEFDRFSMIQQLSRSLTESVSDMNEITQSIDNIVRDSDSILLQQSRLSADLEQGLMNTRLLPFTGLVPRFERIIRQVNSELGKQAHLTVLGAERELDRTILDRIVAPLEHLIRNAIAHGVESPEKRRELGKDETGQLTLSITREGSEILLSLADDGQGIAVEKVKQKALKQNLINPDKMPSDEELIQLILTSGFSTSDDVSQISGRGVGMDVVSNEIRALKGRLSIQSIAGKGTTFNVRLPLTLSIMQSLMVSCNDKPYAIPMSAVHAGTRASVADIKALLSTEGESRFEFHGEYYQFLPLAQLLDQTITLPDDPKVQLPILLFRYGDMQLALLVDAVNANREIVLKSVGEQLSTINSINGATILGDGQVVFILDIPSLVEAANLSNAESLKDSLLTPAEDVQPHDRTPIAMVVDDSITMRKVSGNLLKRHGFDVITARDGIDAIAQLNEQTPDIILLDVEMPRMDGFEFATLVRNIEQYKELPIIMITSRTGDKHRTRALNIGVNSYLGKPYQELELVETMQNLLGTRYPDTRR